MRFTDQELFTILSPTDYWHLPLQYVPARAGASEARARKTAGLNWRWPRSHRHVNPRTITPDKQGERRGTNTQNLSTEHANSKSLTKGPMATAISEADAGSGGGNSKDGSVWKNQSERAEAAVRSIRRRTKAEPAIGIVCGSGLGGIGKHIEKPLYVPYEEIEGWATPSAAVAGHKHQLVFGELNGTTVVCMLGRLHYYQGLSMKEITFPMRVLSKLGVKTVVMTNAAGGINPRYSVGGGSGVEARGCRGAWGGRAPVCPHGRGARSHTSSPDLPLLTTFHFLALISNLQPPPHSAAAMQTSW